MRLSRQEILDWLRQDDPAALTDLWQLADLARQEHVGDRVHLRGLIEFSNICRRSCHYCGLRAPNLDLTRYCMAPAEVLACARVAHARGYGTVVLQAGEIDDDRVVWLGDVVAAIKNHTPLAITLSVGEHSEDVYRLWRERGADRYLLRFETSDAQLLATIHPPLRSDLPDRLQLLLMLRKLGYEIGGGIMVGLPGQTRASVAQDIELFADLDLDMIGIGTYIPHPGTPLGQDFLASRANATDPAANSVPDQMPDSVLATCKVIALARLVCPEANIPATTALATITRRGYLHGLISGANVIMPDLTPPTQRRLYEIYPTRLRYGDSYQQTEIAHAVAAAGRQIGVGRGDRQRGRRREQSVGAE